MLETAAKVIFGPMVNFIMALYSTRRSQRKEDREFRRKAFNEHFIPAFKALEEIHLDYMRSFHNFYEMMRKMETPSKDMLEKFREYGMQYATWREDTRSFVGVCEVLAKDYRLANEKEAIVEFANAIKSYFRATHPDTSELSPASWFTSFLNDFDHLIRSGRSPWDPASYSGRGYNDDPPGTFIEYVTIVYRTELPARWKRVNEAKTALQKIVAVS